MRMVRWRDGRTPSGFAKRVNPTALLASSQGSRNPTPKAETGAARFVTIEKTGPIRPFRSPFGVHGFAARCLSQLIE